MSKLILSLLLTFLTLSVNARDLIFTNKTNEQYLVQWQTLCPSYTQYNQQSLNGGQIFTFPWDIRCNNGYAKVTTIAGINIPCYAPSPSGYFFTLTIQYGSINHNEPQCILSQ